MKTPVALAVALSLAGGIHAAAPLDLAESQAKVILPYAEVKALLEAAQPKVAPKRPPIDSAIASARISFALDSATPAATAVFEVDVFASDWRIIPLIGTPFILKSATAPGATVLIKDGILCLLVREPGRVAVTLDFEIPTALVEPGAAPVSLRVFPAAIGRLAVSKLPPRVRAILAAENRQSTTGALPIPANGGEVTLQLVEDKPVVATTWAAEVQTLVVQREDRLSVVSRIHLRGDSGSGLSAELELPGAAMQARISGPDLQPARQGADRKTLLAWNTAGILDREISVAYDLSSPAPGEPWTVQLPRIAKASRATGRTILVPQAGTRISSKAGRILDAAQSLPSWADASLSASGALEVASAEPFLVETRVLPRLEADTARIPRAEYHTRLVPDGAQLCEARIQIQHRGPLRWRFSLPKESELLSCEVDGRSVNPLIAGDGLLELAIGGSAQSDTSSLVSLSYTARGVAFAPVEGRRSLALPATPLFIEELAWGVALPAGYETTAFEGNVEPVAGGSETNFRRRLVRNDAPAVEIYYRKRDTTR